MSYHRVSHLLVHLGWVDIHRFGSSNILPFGPANSAKLPSAKTESGRQWNTKKIHVHEQVGHPAEQIHANPLMKPLPMGLSTCHYRGMAGTRAPQRPMFRQRSVKWRPATATAPKSDQFKKHWQEICSEALTFYLNTCLHLDCLSACLFGHK